MRSSMEELVVIVKESGKTEVYQRVQVAPDVIEYKEIPCSVFGPPAKNSHLTWLGASVAVAVWTIQFGVGKFYDLVLDWMV